MKKKSRWNRNYNLKPQRAPQPYFNFNSITVHFRDCQLWLLLSEIKIYCLWSVSTGIFLFSSHMQIEKEHLYMLVPCAICWGFQSMETYVSTSQVAQFGFSDGCNWSLILWQFSYKSNRRLVSRDLFFTTIKSSCILKLWTSCLQSAFTIMSQNPKSHTDCTVFIAGHWQGSSRQRHRGRQGKALGQCMIVLMWFPWYFVFQQKPNHISTDCHVQTRKLQLHRLPTLSIIIIKCTQCYYWYLWQTGCHFLHTCQLLMMLGWFIFSRY